ncbi:MAG: hypothetical protein WCD86_27930 [Ktedonobacteraceae bacterium]
MSTTGPPENAYLVTTWPQQDDPLPEDYRAIIESLLNGKVSISRTIKVRFWSADISRKQGEYDQAMEQYGSLLKYAYGDTSKFSEAEIACISKALIDYVDCGRFSPRLPLLEQQQKTSNGMTTSINTSSRLAHLLETAARGIAWLDGKGKLAWTAGLQLERALLLKNQGKLEEALCEMKEAHQKREAAREAPGYSLFTHKLELAELLYTTANGKEDDKLHKAADLLSVIFPASESTLKERMLSSLVLAKIRQKQGEENAANVELGKAQKFAYEIEQAAIAENSHQVLDVAYQDAKRLAEVLAALDQKLQTVTDKAERIKDVPVYPATAAPAVIVGSSQRAIYLRHISCYVSLPQIDDDIFSHKVLLSALRQILECNPFYWQVGCRDDKLVYRQPECSKCLTGNNTSKGNRDCWLRCSDMFIADIKDWSPDVVADLGIIYAMRMMGEEGRLSIILKPDKQDATGRFTAYDLDDFGETISIPHDLISGGNMSEEQAIDYSIQQVKQRLVSVFSDQRLSGLKKPREHYLSALWIEEKCRYTDKNMNGAISKKYITMEAFREAIKGSNERITAKNAAAAANDLSPWRVTPDVIRSVFDAVISLLGEGHA